MISNLQHTMSVDGLTLTTTAVVDGKDVTLTYDWDTVTDAQDHYDRISQLHAQKVRDIAARPETVTVGSSVAYRRLGTVFGRMFVLGRMRGEAFDQAKITIGNHAWRAQIDERSGRIRRRTWRHTNEPLTGRTVYGLGFRTWALYLAIYPTAVGA